MGVGIWVSCGVFFCVILGHNLIDYKSEKFSFFMIINIIIASNYQMCVNLGDGVVGCFSV